jgi:hypothetical protein
MMYRNEEVMKAAGDIEDNDFINPIRNETALYIGHFENLEGQL